MNNTENSIVTLGALQMDFLASPIERTTGAKHPARIMMQLGGSAANTARAAIGQNITTSVISAQAPDLAALCHDHLAKMGVRGFINHRIPGHDGGITVGLPRSGGGAYELFVQRMALRREDITTAARAALDAASLIIVGPLAQPDRDTLDLIEEVAATNRAALLPHPDLVRHPEFGRLARKFVYIQVNAAEAALLAPEHNGNLPVLGMKMRWILGGETEFAITNGSASGLIWAHNPSSWDWTSFEPPSLVGGHDVGAGDCWATSYLIARRLLRMNPRAACDRACALTANWMAGEPFTQGGRHASFAAVTA